eukprot:854570-Pleurochrysis_carterae.AAC.1
MVDDEPGEQINMTNWASPAIPEAAFGRADLHQRIQQMVDNGDSLFREDLSRDNFISLFSPFNPHLVTFRATRFVQYLASCERDHLNQKISPSINLPATHMEQHKPIRDRLQSSYDDVNAELEHVRKHTQKSTHFQQWCSLVAMVWVMRVRRALARCISRAAFGMAVVRADPNVSAFNQHEHFLRILTAGFSKWLLAVVAAGGPGYMSVPSLIRACDFNLSTACILHFLHDFAFLFK